MKLILAFLAGIALAMSSLAQTRTAPMPVQQALVEVYRSVKDGAIANVCIENRTLGSSLNGKLKDPIEVTKRRIFIRGLTGVADHERRRIAVQREGSFAYAGVTYEQWVIPGTPAPDKTSAPKKAAEARGEAVQLGIAVPPAPPLEAAKPAPPAKDQRTPVIGNVTRVFATGILVTWTPPRIIAQAPPVSRGRAMGMGGPASPFAGSAIQSDTPVHYFVTGHPRQAELALGDFVDIAAVRDGIEQLELDGNAQPFPRYRWVSGTIPITR